MVNYVKTCLVLLLFSVLLFYAYNSINKFNEKKIAVSTYRDFGDSDKELRYPSVTVCSGFRKGIETPESIVRKAVEDGIEDPSTLGPSKMSDITYGRRDFLFKFVQAVDDVWDGNTVDNDTFWSSEFHEYAGGHCHTWSPQLPTKPGEVNSLYLSIKLPPRTYHHQCDEFGSQRCFMQFPVFFHQPGEFVFSKAMSFIGRSRVFPEMGKKIKFVMTKKVFKRKSTEKDPCDKGSSVAEWKECLLRAYDEKAGCEMPWKSSAPEKACNMSSTHLRFTSFERSLWWDIDRHASSATGCPLPCQHTEFSVERVPYEYEDDFSQDYQYAIQVYYLEKVTEIQEEFEAFDVFSLVGELGGALGLFLGWSCLNLLLDLVQVPIDRIRKRGRKLSSFGASGAGAKEAHGVQVLKV